MIAAVAGLCGLVVWALTYAVGIANARDRLEAKVWAWLAFALTIAGVFTGHRWWSDRQDESSTARIAVIEAAWQRDPVLAAFQRHDPEQYRFTRNAVDARRPELRGDPDALIFAGRHSLDLRYVLGSWIKQASDDAVIGYAKALVAAAGELEAKDPQLCVLYLYPAAEKIVVPGAAEKDAGVGAAEKNAKAGMADAAPSVGAAVAALSAATLEADTAATADVIKSAATQPKTAPKANRAQTLLQPVLRGLDDDFGADWQVINRPYERDADPARLCKVSASFYRRVLKLPPADAGDALRYRMLPHA